MAFAKHMDLFPRSPVYVGDRPALEMDLSIITYNANSARIEHLSSIDELSKRKNDSNISWVNISGLKDIDSIKRLGSLYNLHPLSIEDILNTEQQPKVEIFSDYRFLSIKTIQHERNFYHEQRKLKKALLSFRRRKGQSKTPDEFLIDQISIVIMKNTLLTFQEISGDSFDGVRKRILEGIGQIRKTGTDHLAYAIIDAVVDAYSHALNHLEEDIENFEDRATKTSDYKFIEEIQDTKKYLLQIRRAISPLKENVALIIRQDNFFLSQELKPFLRDLMDHLNNAVIVVEHYREWLSNIMDVNLSVLSHQMNKVMKVLAVISTIFIPLTFIAGVYGMNFDIMPELRYEFGYPIVLGGMGMIALVMIVVFKIRRWF